MPKVTYIGPYDEVEVPSLGLTCARGGAIDVSADDAKALLEQAENWQAATASKTTAASTADDKKE